MRYKVREIRPDVYQVVNESGHPVYDNARDGNDKPATFKDYDNAARCAEVLNNPSGEIEA